MNLAPPATAYTAGDSPTHASGTDLAERVSRNKSWLIKALRDRGYLNITGGATRKAVEDGIVDLCEKKPLWNIAKVRETLAAPFPALPVSSSGPVAVAANKNPFPLANKPEGPQRQGGPLYTDLDSIGTYFGVGKIKVGKWLEELGLRAMPAKQVNESGDYDMLDFANASKEKFSMKKPTAKAMDEGYVEVTVVTKGNKEFEIYKWNLEMVKDLLVRAGHPLDLEKKMMYKGKGKNSDVQVETMDDRAKKLYGEWQALYNDKTTRATAFEIFKKKPKPLLERVEKLMGAPGYLVEERYKKS